MKKLISFVLALVMLASIVPAAFAAGSDSESADPLKLTTFICMYENNSSDESAFKMIYTDGKYRDATVKGVSYDKATRTITLDNINNTTHSLIISRLGGDVRVFVKGDCVIGGIYYLNDSADKEHSLIITGTGKLTIQGSTNEGSHSLTSDSIVVSCEGVAVNVVVESTVSVEIPYVYIGETAVYDKNKAFIVAGKPVDLGDGNPTYEGTRHVRGICVPEKSVYCGKRLIKKDDPDGLYACNVNSGNVIIPDDVITSENSIDIYKYTYDDRLGCYTRKLEDSFKKELTEAELNAKGYSFNYVKNSAPEPIEHYKSDDEDGEPSYKSAYLYKDRNDPDTLYATKNAFNPEYDKENVYPVYKLKADATGETYDIVSEENLTFDQFDEGGYYYYKDEDRNSVKLKCNTENGTKEMKKIYNPNDPDGTYGMYDNFYYRYPYYSQRFIVKFNDDKNRYEIVEEKFSKYIDVDPFFESCEYLTYKNIRQSLKLVYATVTNMKVYADADGRNYTVEPYNMPYFSTFYYVYDLDENNFFMYNNMKVYKLVRNTKVRKDNLTEVNGTFENEFRTYSSENGESISYKGTGAVKLDTLKINLLKSKVYKGKTIKPAVTVQNGSYALKKGTDYTLTYKKNKSVGEASAVITGTGLYEGTVTRTFKILPKSVKLGKLKGAKKSFTAKWKKNTEQTTGYQLQYSLKKSFKSAKTVKIKSNKTAKLTVKKLKSKKTYYVRLRTYKKVGTKTYASAWSKEKTVKTK